MLAIKNLSKKYGRLQALKDVNLTVSKGEIVGSSAKTEQERPLFLNVYLSL